MLKKQSAHLKSACQLVILTGAVLIAAPFIKGISKAQAADLFKKEDKLEYHSNLDRWHKPYAGVTLGVGAIGSEVDDRNGDLENNQGSVSASAVFGYNFGIVSFEGNGHWVIGLEGDIGNLSGKTSETSANLGTVTLDANWIASARLRAGYAWEKLFLYGTAGIAVSDIDLSYKGKTSNDDDLRAGLALGLGAEWAMNDEWTARLEGISYDFGEDTININGESRKRRLGAGTIRLGVSRNF